MGDFFDSLLNRSMGETPGLRPRLVSPYEPFSLAEAGPAEMLIPPPGSQAAGGEISHDPGFPGDSAAKPAGIAPYGKETGDEPGSLWAALRRAGPVEGFFDREDTQPGEPLGSAEAGPDPAAEALISKMANRRKAASARQPEANGRREAESAGRPSLNAVTPAQTIHADQPQPEDRPGKALPVRAELGLEEGVEQASAGILAPGTPPGPPALLDTAARLVQPVQQGSGQAGPRSVSQEREPAGIKVLLAGQAERGRQEPTGAIAMAARPAWQAGFPDREPTVQAPSSSPPLPRARQGELQPSASYDSARAENPPTIQVTIGRIEVRATPAAAPRPAQERKGAAVLSLEEYLRMREGGRK